MAYYVYILSNKNNNVLYTGITKDLMRRVYEHRHHFDKNSFTAKYNVTKLVYFEETTDVKAAIEREKTDQKLEQDEETFSGERTKSYISGYLSIVAWTINEIATSARKGPPRNDMLVLGEAQYLE